MTTEQRWIPSPQPVHPSFPPSYAVAHPGLRPLPVDPGRGLGIAGLVLSIVANLVGLIVSVVALRRSRRAGFRNGPALAGVVIGAVTTGATLIAIVAGVLVLGNVVDHCQQLGPGTHQVGGVTYTCG